MATHVTVYQYFDTSNMEIHFNLSPLLVFRRKQQTVFTDEMEPSGS